MPAEVNVKLPSPIVKVCSPTLITEEDLKVSTALLRQSRRNSLAELAERLRAVHLIALARVGDLVIGVAALRPPTDLPPFDCFTVSKSQHKLTKSDLELTYLAVHPGYHALGVGRSLVKALVDACPTQVIYAVSDVTNLGSITLKGHLGFCATGESFRDRKSDAQLQVYILGPRQ